MHIRSGRILEQPCQKTPGVMEYLDTGKITETLKFNRARVMERAQERVQPDSDDDSAFLSLFGANVSGGIFSDSSGMWGSANDGKGALKGKGKGKAPKPRAGHEGLEVGFGARWSW